MKGRLITNGILGLLQLIILIIFIVMCVKAANDIIYLSSGSGYTTSGIAQIQTTASVGIGFWALLIIGWIANLVMGIVTLSMEKSPTAHGLTIASGVLAILGGVFGVNAIVSFIGAARA